MKNKIIKHQNGEVMIESLIVYLVTFTLLFLILALIMISYQKFTIKTVASDVAVKAAQNIRYAGSNAVDIENGSFSKEEITSMKAYRYLFGGKGTIEKNIAEKGKMYSYKRLMRTTFKGVVDTDNTQVHIGLIPDGPALRHVKVSISGVYKLPFDEILNFFGLSKLTEYEAVECASCTDILDYINYIDFSKNAVSTIYGDIGKLGKLVDKVWSIVNKIIHY